jgi:hypothetical protein
MQVGIIRVTGNRYYGSLCTTYTGSPNITFTYIERKARGFVITKNGYLSSKEKLNILEKIYIGDY